MPEEASGAGYHRCFVPGCRLRIPDGYAICPTHWPLLTLPTQRLWMLAYHPGMTPDDEDTWSDELHDAVACTKFDLQKPAATRPAQAPLFAPTEAPVRFTQARLAECLKRELKWRRQVYRTRVANHRMSQRDMDEEIAMMEQILAHGFTPP